jgi:glycosyltransferase involved in cell wall biosynthesis
MEAWKSPSPGARVRRSLLYRWIRRIEGTPPEGDYTEYGGHDIYHSTFFPLPDRARTGGHSGPQRFVTLYDVIAIQQPEYFAKLPDQIDLIRKVAESVGPEDWVFAISECTKQDFCAFRPDVDPERVIVTYLAASELFYPHQDAEAARAVRERYGISDKPYLLSLATLEPRKNIEHVIRCFARWAQQEGVDDVNLVLVGERGWGHEEILAEVSRFGNLRDRIIVTGRAADEDLAAIYSGALAFLYLSFYEGFGLPPLEAMQCGAPVITSDRSSLPEVVGSAGLQLNPADEDGLCAALQRIWTDSELRMDMSRASLEQAKQFSWQRCADETAAGYRKALRA